MIISASARTDIPAFYGEWFRNRFRAGYALVVNPFGGQISRVSLRDGVDGFVFWTRNAAPFLPVLAEVWEAGFPFTLQYTVTDYPRALERSVVESDRSIAVIRHLADSYGPRTVVWRYDPIVISSLISAEDHLRHFTTLAQRLEGAVDEVVVSFVQPYRKTIRNMDRAARLAHFTWSDPSDEEKRQILSRLAVIARGHGMALTICTQPHLATPESREARCVDALRLTDMGKGFISARTKGTRPGCLCAESRDIGAYESCPHGCVYCYAVNSTTEAKRRLHFHDPQGEFLIPSPLSLL